MTRPIPRMLVLDLDGTTLTADGGLDPRDVRAAHALRDHGVPVTIATGRLYTGTFRVARELGVTGCVAVMNGSELVDTATDRAVHARYVQPSQRGRIRQVLADSALEPFLFGSRTIHLGPDRRYSPYLSIWTEDLVHHDDPWACEAWHARDLVSISAVGPKVRLQLALDQLHADFPGEIGGEIFQTWEGEGFLNLRCPREDKGTALRRLAEERGFTAEDCVAVGDWTNDLPMLRVAGRSFAMAGADPAAIEAADEVLDSPRHGGGAVAELARRVWGLDVD